MSRFVESSITVFDRNGEKRVFRWGQPWERWQVIIDINNLHMHGTIDQAQWEWATKKLGGEVIELGAGK